MLVQSMPYPNAALVVGDVTYEGLQATRSETTVTSFSINRPATVDEGDFLLAMLGCGADNLVAAPAGWDMVCRTSYGRASLGIFRKFVGPSEPSSYTFNYAVSRRVNAAIFRFKGVDPLRPINHADVSGLSANTTVHTVPARRAIEAKAYAFDCVTGGWGGFSYTPPSGVTEILDTANTTTGDLGALIGAGFSGEIGSVGTLASRNWTCSTGLHYASAAISLNPENGASVNIGMVRNRAVTQVNTNSTSIAANMPSGITPGDLLIAFVGASGTSQTITTPSGWTLIESDVNGSARFAAYSRVADGSEGSTQTFNYSVSGLSTATIIRLQGQSGTPIEASAVATSTSLNPPCPSVTTTGSDRTLLTAVYGLAVSRYFIGWPSSLDLIAFSPNLGLSSLDGLLAVGSEVVSAGATGTRTYNYRINFGAPPSVMITVAIAPA
jgi:hypothetical protein